jgi:hypothetical protein
VQFSCSHGFADDEHRIRHIRYGSMQEHALAVERLIQREFRIMKEAEARRYFLLA